MTYLDSAEDLEWLRTQHLANVATQDELERTVCAILEGNEDCPDRITLYSSRDISSPPIAIFVVTCA